MSNTSPAAVVVTWRAGAGAGACLDRLAVAAPGWRRVLVDNESDPTRLQKLLAGRPDVETVVHAHNAGFAAGANSGLAHAFAGGSQHALLLNDDVLLEPGCADALVAAAGADRCTAPRIDAPGADAFGGGEIDWRRGFGSHRDGALDYLTGAALCLPRSVWDRVGALDERLFLYYEDVDWCVRARAIGVELAVVAEARARHQAGTSSGGASGRVWAYYSTRNRLWFLEWHRGRWAARREAVQTVLRAAASVADAERRRVATAKLAGARDWFAGRLGPRSGGR